MTHSDGQSRLAVGGCDRRGCSLTSALASWVTEPSRSSLSPPRSPAYAHPGDAGADLVSAEARRLGPGERALVGTGVRIALPDGYVAFVVPRSGLAAKHGITIVNTPGTVDAGYRGEIKVTLLNTDAHEPYDIAVGDRIAQLIVMPVTRATLHPGRRAARQRPRRRRIRIDRLPGTDPRARRRTAPMTDDSTTDRPARSPHPTDRADATGPFDESEANPVRPYIDLGGIKILPREGLNLRLEVEEQTKRIVAVGLDYAGLDAAGAAVRRAAHQRAVGRDPRADPRRRSASRAAGSRSARARSARAARRGARRRGATARRASASRGSSASTGRAGSCAA